MTADDFEQLNWCEYLYDLLKDNRMFELDIELEKFAKRGNELGFRGVKKRWDAYVASVKPLPRVAGSELVTTFPGQALELRLSNWMCDETGIWRAGLRGREYACAHPIMPVKRVIDVDEGKEFSRIAYSRNGQWREVLVPKSTIASTQKIIELSDSGISVTNENAKHLIAFLQELEDMNYERIPEERSTSRLGWINENEFSPYAETLIFNDSSAFRIQRKTVAQEGDYDTWLRCMRQLRRESMHMRIMLAASFASPLLRILDVLPSFVHLWSSESATGKTVALMVAASVWGNPARGAYVQSYNSTTVAMERLAEFYNSLPLALDELQQAQNDKGTSNFNVYRLSQGSGRSRSTRAGGLDKLPTWNNFILSTGESPLTTGNEGAGALARVINIELRRKIVDAKTGNKIITLIQENYGHAGKQFVETIQTLYSKDLIRQIYSEFLSALNSTGQVQDKQAAAAAALMTGDMIASAEIFDDMPLTVADIKPFLLTTSETSVGVRAYDYLCDWVTANVNGFIHHGHEPTGKVLGRIDGNVAYIITGEYNKALNEGGFNEKSVTSALISQGLIHADGNRTRQVAKIYGRSSRVVALTVDGIEDYT